DRKGAARADPPREPRPGRRDLREGDRAAGPSGLDPQRGEGGGAERFGADTSVFRIVTRMHNAECRIRSGAILHSAFCILHSAFCIRPMKRLLIVEDKESLALMLQ